MNIELTGRSLIGFNRGSETSKTFCAFDPQTGDKIEPQFYSVTADDLARAVESANEAAVAFGKISGLQKARFLRQIAENIEALGDILPNRAAIETGLPMSRFAGERARTCAQLRMFADLVEEGSWVDARIDTSDPERKPLPKPDVRSMLRPIGPVAIFGAGNFPLAFSVAGGDTASAFAAGCPIIVKAHPAHPGTSELVGSAVAAAVKACGLHEGVFSLLFADDLETGQMLVRHPLVKAVGFTGSRAGGRALMDIAASRDVPVPVYAEMSSVNPTFILPHALTEKADTIAAGLHDSFTLGAGQFCTKPGIVVMPENPHAAAFRAQLEDLTRQSPTMCLLSSGIYKSYEKGVAARAQAVGAAVHGNDSPGFSVNASVFQTSAKDFLSDPELSEEIFGPTTLFVSTQDRTELLEIARRMEGQLTTTIHGTDNDLNDYADLIEILETKVGRLVFNGFPTGVEVCHAMVHGGPYPATSDSRSTSVGTRAINRFARLVCYQDFPQNALPDELKNSNPLGISRLQDGTITRDGL